MTRRRPSSDEIYQSALQKARALDTRLNEVRQKLAADLAHAKSWLDSQSISVEDFSQFCEYVKEFAARLPQACGQRFLFDTAFIRALAADFGWAHELAFDILSVWTCGAAYLACFTDYLDHERPNPYLIEPTHPPYSVRAEALIKAARHLGLEAYTTGLTHVVHSWDQSNWTAKKDKHFIGLSNHA